MFVHGAESSCEGVKFVRSKMANLIIGHDYYDVGCLAVNMGYAIRFSMLMQIVFGALRMLTMDVEPARSVLLVFEENLLVFHSYLPLAWLSSP